jgi:hypothetical protein
MFFLKGLWSEEFGNLRKSEVGLSKVALGIFKGTNPDFVIHFPITAAYFINRLLCNNTQCQKNHSIEMRIFKKRFKIL